MAPTLLDRRTTYSAYLTVERLSIRIVDGSVVSRDIERHGNAVAVLPYDEQRRGALVARLFRAAVFCETGAKSLQGACAGMIEDEDDASPARRG